MRYEGSLYRPPSEAYSYLLRDLEKLLPNGLFYRIQRSYLITLQYVDSYDAKTVTLKNGVTLPLKAQRLNAVQENGKLKLDLDFAPTEGKVLFCYCR